MTSNVRMAKLPRLDRWGMAISSACLIHCLAVPLLAAALPVFAATLPGEEWVHTVLLALALPVSGLALRQGYRRHRLARPALIGGAGLAMMAAALFIHGAHAETLLTVTGGMLVASAHLLNWRGHRRAAG